MLQRDRAFEGALSRSWWRVGVAAEASCAVWMVWVRGGLEMDGVPGVRHATGL